MVLRLYVLMTILSLTIITVGCQSFQYSNGWMNGKRGDITTRFNVYQPLELKSRYAGIRKIGEQSTVPAIINCNLQKLRIILLGNNNEKFHLLPCGLPNIPLRAVNFNKSLNQFLTH